MPAHTSSGRETNPNVSKPNVRPSIAPTMSRIIQPRRPTPSKKLFYTSAKEDPPHLRDDEGLACLTSQLGRINEQIRYLDYVKNSVGHAEEQCRRELAASLAKSLVASSASNDGVGGSGGGGSSRSFSQPNSAIGSNNLSEWTKYWYVLCFCMLGPVSMFKYEELLNRTLPLHPTEIGMLKWGQSTSTTMPRAKRAGSIHATETYPPNKDVHIIR